jgi:uncharacterized protein (DUF4213/DUF364 family)
VVQVNGVRRCGLASTLRNENHHHDGRPVAQDAGELTKHSARELAEFVRSFQPLTAAIGIATINALLPMQVDLWHDRNAEDVLADHGAGKRVVLIGHFPFIPRLREQVGNLLVLEQQPQGEDLPAEAASRVIPRADVVAITGTSLINHTFDQLLTLCRPQTQVLVLGPSTPLSPILFDYGVDLLSGAVVENVDTVIQAVGQAANFQQVHRQGVRLVTIKKG